MKRRQGFFTLMVAIGLVAVCAYTADAQGRRGQRDAGGRQGGRQGGFQRPGGMMGGGMMGRGGAAMLLGRKDVQDELELIDDQIEQLQNLRNDTDMREMFSSVRDLPREEQMAKIRQLMEDAQKKTQKKIDEILLPHQAKRLQQLAFQFQMQGGLTRAIRSDDLRQQLNISDAQREQLEEKSREMEEKIRQQVTEIRRKAQEELMRELTPEQRAKINAMIGEPFEFQEQEMQRGPGGPGARPGGGAFGGGADRTRRRPGG
jgi:hypothetical protein